MTNWKETLRAERAHICGDKPVEVLAKGFGDGWMTSSASDLAKIAVTWAGFDAKELAKRLAMTKTRGMKMNAATVARVLGEMESAS